MNLFQFRDGHYDINDMILPKKGDLNEIGVKAGALRRNLQGEVCDQVFTVDTRGNGHYYLPNDIFWLVEPTEDDAGVTAPIDGATPRDKYGKKIDDGTEKIRITIVQGNLRIEDV